MASVGPAVDGPAALSIAGSGSVVQGQRNRSAAAVHHQAHIVRSRTAHRGTCTGVAPMRLSGHEINSRLRQKLEMSTGRHLYAVLGTYERLERYEKVDF